MFSLRTKGADWSFAFRESGVTHPAQVSSQRLPTHDHDDMLFTQTPYALDSRTHNCYINPKVPTYSMDRAPTGHDSNLCNRKVVQISLNELAQDKWTLQAVTDSTDCFTFKWSQASYCPHISQAGLSPRHTCPQLPITWALLATTTAAVTMAKVIGKCEKLCHFSRNQNATATCASGIGLGQKLCWQLDGGDASTPTCLKQTHERVWFCWLRQTSSCEPSLRMWMVSRLRNQVPRDVTFTLLCFFVIFSSTCSCLSHQPK